MSALTVTIVQAVLYWHDAEANRKMFGEMLSQLETATDLIVLPEMFTTGFTMDAPSQAEEMNGPSIDWMAEMAADRKANVCGSLIIKEHNHYFNRFVCMSPSGERSCYDKRHLFRLADEHNHYTAGSERVTFNINDWRICPQVCYDLRFPVWSRNRGDYDLLLYVANWPNRRHFAWETLLRARAIENLSYLAGVNRTGTDGNNLPYSGGSAIVDYLGADLANLADQVGMASATLDRDNLQKFRDRFAFHVDADNFLIGDQER